MSGADFKQELGVLPRRLVENLTLTLPHVGERKFCNCVAIRRLGFEPLARSSAWDARYLRIGWS